MSLCQLIINHNFMFTSGSFRALFASVNWNTDDEDRFTRQEIKRTN